MNGFQMHFYTSLSVRFVGGVEKWQDGKLVGVWKSRRIEKIWFSLIFVWLEGWKSRRVENFFCLVGKKKGRMENVVYIN